MTKTYKQAFVTATVVLVTLLLAAIIGICFVTKVFAADFQEQINNLNAERITLLNRLEQGQRIQNENAVASDNIRIRIIQIGAEKSLLQRLLADERIKDEEAKAKEVNVPSVKVELTPEPGSTEVLTVEEVINKEEGGE